MRIAVIYLLVWLSFAGPGRADEKNNIWIMWERVIDERGDCSGAGCADIRDFQSHFLMNLPARDATSLFSSLAPMARRYGSANVRHDALPLCPAAVGGDEPLELSDKVDTLRGLDGIFVDLRGVRGPAGYQGQFGADAQAYLTDSFAMAGIAMKTRAEYENSQTVAALSLRYSPDVAGCRPWSVILSLKQNATLLRDPAIMIEAVTWSASARQDENNIEYNAGQAAQDAIRLFVADYLKAQQSEALAAQ